MTLQKNLKEAHEYLEKPASTPASHPSPEASAGCFRLLSRKTYISGTSATPAEQRGNRRLAFACSQE